VDRGGVAARPLALTAARHLRRSESMGDLWKQPGGTGAPHSGAQEANRDGRGLGCGDELTRV
jgi:hypothetical protein